MDVSGAGTIYSSSAYKALEAGTDAPRAMVGLLTCSHVTDGLHVMSCDCRMAILQVAVGKFACQNCVVMRSGAYELFMLGAHSVSAVTLATWKQVVDTHTETTRVLHVHAPAPSPSPTCV